PWRSASYRVISPAWARSEWCRGSGLAFRGNLRPVPDRKTEPRKRPRQARSKVLYDALIEATQRLLASEGLDAVTTNRVAELAGVSIGSLYQYFPSREALIAAV